MFQMLFPPGCDETLKAKIVGSNHSWRLGGFRLSTMTKIAVVLFVMSGVAQVKLHPIFGALEPSSTTPYSHISSYLNQRRSDSRAEKPDEFPNFDFDITRTTKRPVTRVQVYKHVVGKVYEDIRDRVASAIAQGQSDRLASRQLDRLENIGENSEDSTTEFVGLTLEEDSDGPSIVFEASNGPSDETTATPPEDEHSSGSDLNGNFLAAKLKNKTRALATLVFTPLFSIWTAHRNLHPPSTSGDTDPSNILQRQQHNARAVQTWITNGIKQNLRGMPLRNAFYKYSNLVGKGSYNETVDNPFAGNMEAPRSDLIETEGKLDSGGLDDDDDKMLRSGEVERQDTGSAGGRLMFNEGLGIYVLEIIGSIAGLTWGAISQIQSLFGGRQ